MAYSNRTSISSYQTATELEFLPPYSKNETVIQVIPPPLYPELEIPPPVYPGLEPEPEPEPEPEAQIGSQVPVKHPSVCEAEAAIRRKKRKETFFICAGFITFVLFLLGMLSLRFIHGPCKDSCINEATNATLNATSSGNETKEVLKAENVTRMVRRVARW